MESEKESKRREIKLEGKLAIAEAQLCETEAAAARTKEEQLNAVLAGSQAVSVCLPLVRCREKSELLCVLIESGRWIRNTTGENKRCCFSLLVVVRSEWNMFSPRLAINVFLLNRVFVPFSLLLDPSPAPPSTAKTAPRGNGALFRW